MAQGLAVEWIIRPAVFELFLQAAADLDLILWRDGYVAAVKQAMEIASEEQAVVHGVRAALIEGFDVGGFERREGMLLRNCACAEVGIRNEDAESPLA